MAANLAARDSSEDGSESHLPGVGHCWNTIGVTGDRSCPELNTHIHCRNCPVFAVAARSFFDRRAPEGYLADWSVWLAESTGLGLGGDATDGQSDHVVAQGEAVSVLIFRLGDEWLALRTQTVAEVTLPRPVHRVPHRTNAVLSGIVSLQGQVQLCVSLHGLLGVIATPASSLSRLVVLRDAERAETWVFAADDVVGVRRIPCSQWRNVPSTLINPAVGFSHAVLSWNDRSIGLLDEQRIFSALGSLRN
jgi:chemotaxis-related protein WspD